LIAALVVQLTLAAQHAESSEPAAVYLRDAAETRYAGQIERIEVALSGSGNESRLLVRFCHAEGRFGLAAVGRDAHTLLSDGRRWDLTRYRYHFLIGALVLFLIVFRAYRIIRWYRRRKRRAASA